MLPDKCQNVFKQWLGQYDNLIFKIVRAYADSPADQDDLFQEILMQLWSSIPGFQAKASETTWIYRVALNTALVWTRSKTRRRRRHLALITDFSRQSDIQQNCSEALPRQEIIDQLYAAIYKLPKIDGSLILMHLDGLTYQQMAEVLGISASNIAVKLNRAKKQLAQLLKGLIDDI